MHLENQGIRNYFSNVPPLSPSLFWGYAGGRLTFAAEFDATLKTRSVRKVASMRAAQNQSFFHFLNFFMMTGTVRSYNQEKGYGFIKPDDANIPDVFVHFKAIMTDGFKILTEGQRVDFEIANRDEVSTKGPIAENVTPI